MPQEHEGQLPPAHYAASPPHSGITSRLFRCLGLTGSRTLISGSTTPDAGGSCGISLDADLQAPGTICHSQAGRDDIGYSSRGLDSKSILANIYQLSYYSAIDPGFTRSRFPHWSSIDNLSFNYHLQNIEYGRHQPRWKIDKPRTAIAVSR